jgi:hypothetical protein
MRACLGDDVDDDAGVNDDVDVAVVNEVEDEDPWPLARRCFA